MNRSNVKRRFHFTLQSLRIALIVTGVLLACLFLKVRLNYDEWNAKEISDINDKDHYGMHYGGGPSLESEGCVRISHEEFMRLLEIDEIN